MRSVRPSSTLSLALVAAIPVLPALGGGGAWYMDNPSHLLELRALADAPGAGFFTFTERAELGLPVGQVSAPLPWTVLAWLARLGLDPELGNGLATVLSNVLFALAVSRLGRSLGLRAEAAWAAGAIAAALAGDVYGIGGAAGGMWPYRLANALVIFALSRGPGPVAAFLLGGAFWCHTLSATVGMLSLGVAAVAAGWRLRSVPRGHVVTGLSAVAMGAGVWVPLLDPALHDFGGAHPYGWGEVLLALGFPVSPFAFPRGSVVIGGWASIGAWALVVAAALVGATRRAASEPVSTPWHGAPRWPELLAGLCLVELCVLVPSLGGPSPLGPVPFRLHAFAHVALALLAARGLGGVALAALPLALALTTGLAGKRELAIEESDSLVEAYRRAASGGHLVYVHDTFANPGAPASLYWSHPGGLLAARHGGRVVGSWYGISPSPVTRVSRSEDNFFAGLSRRKPREDFVDEVLDRMDAWGVGAVLTWDDEVVGWVDGQRGFAVVSRHDTWIVLARDELPAAKAGRLRVAGNAWWRAPEGSTLATEKATGLLRVEDPGEPTLVDAAAPWRLASLGALALTLAYAAALALPHSRARTRSR